MRASSPQGPPEASRPAAGEKGGPGGSPPGFPTGADVDRPRVDVVRSYYNVCTRLSYARASSPQGPPEASRPAAGEKGGSGGSPPGFPSMINSHFPNDQSLIGINCAILNSYMDEYLRLRVVLIDVQLEDKTQGLLGAVFMNRAVVDNACDG